MKKLLLAAALLAGSYSSPVQAQVSKQKDKEARAQVMLLGTFHFAYHNKDIITTDKKDQIDIMSEQSQRDIEKIASRVARFKPTKIALELMPEEQPRIDSLYQAYLDGRYELETSEVYQLGFRLAKQLGHPRVYCINAWGNLDGYETPGGKDLELREDVKERLAPFWKYLRQTALARDSVEKLAGNQPSTVYRLVQDWNKPESIRRKHENFFREAFQYEEQPYDYTGVDWYSATWFNRNLRIFRNIQRITESPDDRILVIYGGGHLALLQEAVESSPTHRLAPAHKLLK
ncbi:DUF5694 domain-containing protein [Pontibacter actiniarum]|uniref:TraB/GumN family protein n=1 Tax=Pontibacter actiniarum TaxID=323450 RepID=A0A1X9YP12_9BACT|nr:DUF5694 domain-containing protein [Pontibacter actiniarum]ARS34587.1 hypothetical protein CA264_03525 [Pontibacter actiniarum]